MVLSVKRIKVCLVKELDTVRIKGSERVSSPFNEMKQQFDTTVTSISLDTNGHYVFITTAGILQPKHGQAFIFIVKQLQNKDIEFDYHNLPPLNIGREQGKTFNGKSIE